MKALKGKPSKNSNELGFVSVHPIKIYNLTSTQAKYFLDYFLHTNATKGYTLRQNSSEFHYF
jgi:hypothetical protein